MSIEFQEEYDQGTVPVLPHPTAGLKDGVASPDNSGLHPGLSPARIAYEARLRWWLLHILRGSGGMPRYCETGSSRIGVIADLLQAPTLGDPDSRVQDVQEALLQASTLLGREQGGSTDSPAIGDCAMARNVQWLSQSAGLNAIEHEIFEFVAAVRAFRPLRLALITWGEMGAAELPQAFSALLNRPLHAVVPALQRDSRLLRCGLVTQFSHGDIVLDRLIKVPRVLGQRIAAHEDHPAGILSHLVLPLVKPSLGLGDFRHLQGHTQLAQAWLVGALQVSHVDTRQYAQTEAAASTHRGTHLLVTGAPGLGKTEWVRALLTACGDSQAVNAMELVVLAEDGTALSGEDRLSHLRLALSMLRHTAGGVIVFDEADDVFRAAGDSNTSGGDASAVTMANHRASLNRLIEDSRIPVIWIMNHAEILDPAVLRRFDTVIAFEGMPRSVRLAMLQQRLAGVADQAELSRWAEIPQLTPALIDRLAVVVQRAKDANTPMSLDHCRFWLRSRLPGKHTHKLKSKTVGTLAPTGATSTQSFQSPPWDAAAVQVSEDLLKIAAGIGRCGSARLLLYGAPGTGKTAYAHALARMLDKPLMEQRASDLLSPWVGETEQRIHQAFETAIADDAVLFIDEVDSLLAHRDKAARNWEVSQVNELLEQLSDFEGVVVLATNRLDALDDAVLRRMDAKIKFEGLNPAQLQSSFVQLCAQMGVTPSASQSHAASQLKGLTPGDFACLRRRLAFAPIETPDADKARVLMAWLREELRHKTPGAQPMGFYQSDAPSVSQEEPQAVLDLL